MEPYWTVRSGSIPFWMVFNMEPSASSLERYLDDRDTFDDIAIMLFSHGVESVGLAPIERWRALAKRGNGALVGVDADAYPRDFDVFVRYHYPLRERFAETHPIPAPLTIADVERFISSSGKRYDVTWS